MVFPPLEHPQHTHTTAVTYLPASLQVFWDLQFSAIDFAPGFSFAVSIPGGPKHELQIIAATMFLQQQEAAT